MLSLKISANSLTDVTSTPRFCCIREYFGPLLLTLEMLSPKFCYKAKDVFHLSKEVKWCRRGCDVKKENKHITKTKKKKREVRISGAVDPV